MDEYDSSVPSLQQSGAVNYGSTTHSLITSPSGTQRPHQPHSPNSAGLTHGSIRGCSSSSLKNRAAGCREAGGQEKVLVNCTAATDDGCDDDHHDDGNSSHIPLLPVPDAYAGLGYSRWIRGRVLSTLCLAFYTAAYIGYSPFMSQYLSDRLAPDYLDSHAKDNSSNTYSNSSRFNASPCSQNKSDPRIKEEADLQGEVSRQMLWLTMAGTVPNLAATLVLGTYSDVIGRKLLFYLPPLIGLVKMVGSCLVVNFGLSMWYLYGVSFVEGFGGAFTALLMATFAYTADLTPPSSSRTLAIAAIEAAIAVAAAAADVGLGYCIRVWGYTSAALLMAALMFLSAVSVILLPESVRRRSAIQDKPGTCVVGDRNPFKHVKHILALFVTEGPRRHRARFLLGLCSLALTFIVIMGRGGTEVLYQLNRPFCWDSVQVGLFAGLGILGKALGSVTAVHVMQSCCHLSDIAVAFCTLFSSLASNVLYGLAYLPEHSSAATLLLWNTITVGLVSSAVTSAIRAVLSKMVGPCRQGALFAGIAVTETLATLASSALYNTLYAATVDRLPGGVFLIMAGLTALNILLVLIIMIWSGPEPYPHSFEEEIEPLIRGDSDRLYVDVK